jgi:adenylate kinase
MASTTFDEVLDAIEHLPIEQQADLVDVVRRRLAERGRQQIIADAHEARAEFAAGKTRPTSIDDLMREIES